MTNVESQMSKETRKFDSVGRRDRALAGRTLDGKGGPTSLSNCRLCEQDREPFLGEVMIVGQHVRKFERLERHHRPAVHEAVVLVEPVLIERKSRTKTCGCLRQNLDRGVCDYIPDCGCGK